MLWKVLSFLYCVRPKVKKLLLDGVTLIVDRYAYSGVVFSAAKKVGAYYKTNLFVVDCILDRPSTDAESAFIIPVAKLCMVLNFYRLYILACYPEIFNLNSISDTWYLTLPRFLTH